MRFYFTTFAFIFSDLERSYHSPHIFNDCILEPCKIRAELLINTNRKLHMRFQLIIGLFTVNLSNLEGSNESHTYF